MSRSKIRKMEETRREIKKGRKRRKKSKTQEKGRGGYEELVYHNTPVS